MPKVIVYVPAAAWKKLEERGLDPARAVREFAKRGYEIESSGAAVGNAAESGSALEQREEKEMSHRVSSRPERAAPDSPKKRFHPCKHHIPASSKCQYCDA